MRFDHYEVMRDEAGEPYLLGRGGMGETYRARDTTLGREVALKVVHPHLLADPAIRARFLREARATARLHHRNIATIHHQGQTGDTCYYAMEFIRGVTLQQVLAQSGPLPAARALAITRQVVQGLAEAEKHGLVHRDIKPANIMLATEADGHELVKLIDFGLAKLAHPERVGDAEVTRQGSFLGTAATSSPEQCRGEELDSRSDFYSLGVTLWWMLDGRPPFEDPLPMRVLMAHLDQKPPFARLAAQPRPVRELLRSLLEKDPARRPASTGELMRRLDACLVAEGPPPAASRRPPAPKPGPDDETRMTLLEAGTLASSPGGSRRWLLGGGAALLLLAVGTWMLRPPAGKPSGEPVIPTPIDPTPPPVPTPDPRPPPAPPRPEDRFAALLAAAESAPPATAEEVHEWAREGEALAALAPPPPSLRAAWLLARAALLRDPPHLAEWTTALAGLRETAPDSAWLTPPRLAWLESLAGQHPETLAFLAAGPAGLPEDRHRHWRRESILRAERAREWPQAVAEALRLWEQAPDHPEGEWARNRLNSWLGRWMQGDPPAGWAGEAGEAARVDALAERGLPSALEWAGKRRLTADPAQARDSFARAAAAGVPTAAAQYGWMLLHGVGGAADPVEAARWLRRARDAGGEAGMILLADALLAGAIPSEAEGEAVDALLRAADLGNGRAMDRLGDCFRRGRGVAADAARARFWFDSAIEAEHWQSLGNLGVMHMLGEGGPVDKAMAVSLFEQGAERANPWCMFLLGQALWAGEGVAADRTRAEDWLRRAAAAGQSEAAEFLQAQGR
jgi:serine/threonine protein kinase/TPR repeat protein